MKHEALMLMMLCRYFVSRVTCHVIGIVFRPIMKKAPLESSIFFLSKIENQGAYITCTDIFVSNELLYLALDL